MFVLDTDHLGILQRWTQPEANRLAARLVDHSQSDFASMQVLPFDDAAAQVFESLRKQGVRVGTMDLRIAATAIARGYTLLSRNLVDFERVPGLRVEDWTV